MANGKHRLLVSDVNEDLQQFKEDRATRDQTIEQQLTGLEEKLATRDGDFKESLRKAEQAYAANPKQDRSISRLFVIASNHEQIARDHEARVREVSDKLTRIRTLLESGGAVNERRATTRVEGIDDDIDKAFEATDKQIEDLRKEMDEKFGKVYERIDERFGDTDKTVKDVDDDLQTTKRGVDERFEKEVTPLQGKNGMGAKTQEDIAALSQRIDRHQTVINQRFSLAPLGVGMVVGFLVFVIAWFASGLNLPYAFVLGLGFLGLVAGLIYVITGHRQKKIETETRTTSKSRKHKDDDDDDEDDDEPSGFDKLLARAGLSRDSKRDEDDTDTRPIERTTTKETVREREPARSR